MSFEHDKRLKSLERPDESGVTRKRALARRSEVGSFIVMDVMREAAALEAQGRSIVHMEVGQPGTPAPLAARQAAQRALDTETLGYTLALGIPALRDRIARLYDERHGLNVDPRRIVITTGSSAAFVLVFTALFEAGDRVALPTPGYPCYRHILTALGCTPVSIPTGSDTRWMPRAEDIAAAHERESLSAVLIASPANPTGTMIGPERLAEIAAVCRARGLWLISDEIYHGLTYEAPAVTALAADDDAIVINSFSKYFSMTGWRIGWIVVPEALVRPIERLQQNLYISPPSIAQVAALGALDAEEELEANRLAYARNRALLLDALPKAGLDRLAPADGAFYIYADVSHLSADSAAFAAAMLHEAGVAVTPGTDFDSQDGSRFLRFSYAGTHADIAEGARRLSEWLPVKRAHTS